MLIYISIKYDFCDLYGKRSNIKKSTPNFPLEASKERGDIGDQPKVVSINEMKLMERNCGMFGGHWKFLV